MNASFRLRVTAVLVALLTVAVGVRLCGTMWREAALDQGFQMYDNNEHALDAARMADDLRAGAPLRFLGHVNARTVWPPLLPLLETPGFVLFGAAYDTAERQMVVFGFLMLLAAMAFGFALGGPSGVRTGAALVAFVASSPFVASFMVETMTEGPAALFWLVSMAFYALWVRHGRTRDAALCCAFGFGLFMLKFNFGVLWALPLLLYEPWRAGVRPNELVNAWSARPRVHAFWLVYGAVVLGAAALLLPRLLDRGWGGGGLAFGVAHAGTRGLRTTVLVVAGLAALPFLVQAPATWRTARALWRGVGPFGRSFLALALAPTVLWFAEPSHAKGLLHFIAGRVPEIPVWSVEGFLYYPRVFVEQYAPNVWIAVATALLALASVALWPRLAPAERVLPVALVVNVVLSTLHGVKGDRYLYTVAFVVWSCAALSLSVLGGLLAARVSRPAAAALIGPALLVAALAAGPDLPRVRGQLAIVHVPASVGRVLDAVAEVHAASRGTVLFGTWNRLSPPLVEWHLRQRNPDGDAPPRPKNPSWFGTEDPDTLLGRIAADPEIERVIVLVLRPGFPESSPNFELENGWQAPTRTRIDQDPRFERERAETFDDSGYAMTVYRKRPPG